MTLHEIEKLNSALFRERWATYHDCAFTNPALKYPGVYLLAFTSRNLVGKKISEDDVLYVGMSNAKGGVRTRLKQFRDGIETNGKHSGAKRFFREYQRNIPFSKMTGRKKFFFAFLTVKCVSDKSLLTAHDLRMLGHVSCLEYYVIARIKARSGRTPPLNKFGERPQVT